MSKAPHGRRLLLWLPVALMAGVQLWLSSRSRLPDALSPFPGSDKLAHGGWFFLLALLAWRAAREGEGWSRRRRLGGLLLAAALWAASDEAHQWFVPGRAVEAADLLADVAGAALALSLAEGFLTGRRLVRAG
ncbi:MAG TPA: VanZ family protein [Thermoanaerobaculia bacterium]|nr:VanZ family protein [Thermoanaerobaculia bacterium]HPA51249.1 VanZ family protein [Thermoanaerobaculia bacterium]HQN07468.1 VanZ family protein [Thermoanaerobaculia bacterium]HQP86450.1 VanZ family protein [Thermoanaerobaculia bacterium]